MPPTKRRGMLGYYRQFEAMSDEEVREELHRVNEERKRKALAIVEPLDLSATTWHEFPHPDVAAAITYAARRGINRYADRDARELRAELARRHGLEYDRIAMGHGAGELLRAAARTLMEPGDELVTPWPSYPLYPLMARQAGGRAVPVPGRDTESLLGAVTGQTRLLVLANPNDPTGAYMPTREIAALLERLPERVTVLLDEALIHFAETEEPGASLPLLDDFERLIVFRTFSKAYGLAGLRFGYALGGVNSRPLLERLEPALGLDEPKQAGALEGLIHCRVQAQLRRSAIAIERRRLLGELASRPVDAPPSEANFVWLSATGIEGAELAHRLERFGVYVKTGGEFGATDHVRVQVQSAQATDRFVRALDNALAM